MHDLIHCLSFYCTSNSILSARTSAMCLQYLGDITLTLGWRYLLALSTLPLALFLILSPKLLPESLMYLATTGQKDKVEEELKKVARINKRPDLVGTLILDEQSNQESRG